MARSSWPASDLVGSEAMFGLNGDVTARSAQTSNQLRVTILGRQVERRGTILG